MHVASDQLGKHKGRSWSSAGGSETLQLGHCLFLSAFFFFLPYLLNLAGAASLVKESAGVEEEVGSKLDVKQSLRHTVQGHLLTLGLVYFLRLQQTHTLKHVSRLSYEEHPVCYHLIQKGRALIIGEINECLWHKWMTFTH